MDKTFDCIGIYQEEITRRIKTHKRFSEAWLNSESKFNTELFQYADEDFYFYKFAIERQEKGTIPMLVNILYRVMNEYGIKYLPLADGRNTEFLFSILDNGENIGFRFEDFYFDDNIEQILIKNHIDKAIIIHLWKQGKPDEWIKRDNKENKEKGIKVESISLKLFFERYISEQEYSVFLEYLDRYLLESREITGYKPIKFLSAMNLASQKAYTEKFILDWDYKNYKYQILDIKNEKVKDYIYLLTTDIPIDDIVEKYINGEIYKTMLGNNEYAENFMTSEWLFHSLEGKRNFDFTSVISGYLKSIEQLLHKIVMLNVDNNCKISMTGVKKIREKAYKDNVIIYSYDESNKTFTKKNISELNKYKNCSYPYIDMTSAQIEYMDSSIGAFEHFLRKNPQICIDPDLSKTIADMVCCFRIECRNGYFHTHNLKDWKIVEKTRDNALYLYSVLLGAYDIPLNKINELAIVYKDRFDELCKAIREFRHYNLKFIFEYEDGRKRYLEYDHQNNTMEFAENGVQHYESIFFYEVEDFAVECKENSVNNLAKRVELTRKNIPSKIYGVHRNGEYEQIMF